MKYRLQHPLTGVIIRHEEVRELYTARDKQRAREELRAKIFIFLLPFLIYGILCIPEL